MNTRRSRTRTCAACAIAALLGALAGAPVAFADAAPGIIVHEHRTEPVAGFGSLNVHVWRRGAEVQVVALDAREIVRVLRTGTLGDDTVEALGAMGGLPTARTRTIDADGAVTVEVCDEVACAQAIAARGAAIAARTRFEALTREQTAGEPPRNMVRMCPIREAGAGAVTAPNAAWVSAGAQAPCRWHIVATGTLGTWPGDEFSALIRVGDAVFQADRAVLDPVHGG